MKLTLPAFTLVLLLLISVPVVAHGDAAHTVTPLGEGVNPPTGNADLDPGINDLVELLENASESWSLGEGNSGETLDFVARLRCGCSLHEVDLRLVAPDGRLLASGDIIAPAIYWNGTFLLDQDGEYWITWTNIGEVSILHDQSAIFTTDQDGSWLPAAGIGLTAVILSLAALLIFALRRRQG